MQKIAFSTKLEKSQVEKLKQVAVLTRRPQSELVREWIEEGIRQTLKTQEARSGFREFFIKEGTVIGDLHRKDLYQKRT